VINTGLGIEDKTNADSIRLCQKAGFTDITEKFKKGPGSHSISTIYRKKVLGFLEYFYIFENEAKLSKYIVTWHFGNPAKFVEKAEKAIEVSQFPKKEIIYGAKKPLNYRRDFKRSRAFINKHIPDINLFLDFGKRDFPYMRTWVSLPGFESVNKDQRKILVRFHKVLVQWFFSLGVLNSGRPRNPTLEETRAAVKNMFRTMINQGTKSGVAIDEVARAFKKSKRQIQRYLQNRKRR